MKVRLGKRKHVIGLYARASDHEGFGHVVRLRTLGCALMALGADVVFIGKIENAAWLVESLAMVGLPTADLESCPVLEAVLLDTYSLSPEEEFLLYSRAERVVQIRDPGARRWQADLEIVPAPISTLPLTDNGTRRVIGGMDFMIVRDEVLQQRADPQPFTGRLLVFLGGFAKPDFLGEVLAAVSMATWKHGVDVVTEGMPLTGVEPSNMRLCPPGEALLSMASGAHAVICAGGGTSWEMIVLGARLGVIELAENQGENYRALTEGGLAVGLGQLPNGLRQEAFRSLLFEGEGPGIARGPVPDGLGARRCAEQILAMLH